MDEYQRAYRTICVRAELFRLIHIEYIHTKKITDEQLDKIAGILNINLRINK